MMKDASPGAMAHPDRRLLSAADLRCLLDLGYRLGEPATFSDLAQLAVDEIPTLLGKDCWAAINEFGADGAFLGAHVSGTHREVYSHETYGAVINERMVTDHPLVVHAGLLSGPQLPVQIRDFETGCGFQHSGLYRDAYRHLETRHQACQWITVSERGFTLLGLNRRKAAFSGREMALIGELRNLLATAERRMRQVESALGFAEAMGRGSPVCGWVEVDLIRWRPVRTGGPAEGWMAALRGAEEGLSSVPSCLRKLLEVGEKEAWLACPGVPAPGLEVSIFQIALPDRWMVILRHPAARSVPTHGTLTRREREILALAGTGRSRGEVAIQLGIAKRTVDKHFEHVYAKLGVSGRVEALLRAGV